MLERAKACGPIVFAAMREDIIEVAVELGLNSGDPQAIAVARELAEAGADADSPPITTSVKVRYRTNDAC